MLSRFAILITNLRNNYLNNPRKLLKFYKVRCTVHLIYISTTFIYLFIYLFFLGHDVLGTK